PGRHRQHHARRHRDLPAPRQAGVHIEAEVDEADETTATLAEVGVDSDDVAASLEPAGAERFAHSQSACLPAWPPATKSEQAAVVGRQRHGPAAPVVGTENVNAEEVEAMPDQTYVPPDLP